MPPVAAPALSVVVPLYNEEGNVTALVDAVRAALAGQGEWELLLVDDGSTDATASIARACAAADRRVRLLCLARNYGQTTALQAGFDHARGEVVVSLDGDLQNDPADIPSLLAALAEGYDLVAGYRVGRQDARARMVLSYLANRLIRRVSHVPIRDTGCTLKAYRRTLLERVHLYSDMHRFIPAIAAATAGARITEVPVRHHPRRAGASKYGFSRTWKVLADLLTITMIRSFRERPLALFATGTAATTVVALLFAAAALAPSTAYTRGAGEPLILSGAALLWFGLGCYLFVLGLIAEVTLSARRRGGRAGAPLVAREVAW